MSKKLFFLISLILVLGPVSNASAELRALYEFEGNYNNSIGGPAGTPIDNATIVYDADRDSNVLSLDGTDDHVRFGNDSVTGIDIAVTFAAWIKTSTLGTGDSVVTKGYAWRLRGNGGVPRFSTTVLSNTDLDGTTNVADNTWHHIAAVYDADKEKKCIYVDGDLDASVDCNGVLNTTDIYIFAAGGLLKEYGDGSPYVGYPKLFYQGRIDNVRVYDHALTANEVWLLATTGTEALEAEDATLNGVTAVADSNASSGYRVRYFDAQGDYIDFNTIPDGNYLQITYSLGLGTVKRCSVYIDGSDVNTATFEPTGGWGSYDTVLLEVDVTGSVKLQLDADDQTANGGESCASIDKIAILESPPPVPPEGPNHPFLIVDEANYPALQARAAQSPWSEMKDDAISDAGSLIYDPCLTPYKERAFRLRDIVSSNALAYILDPNNRTTYKNKIRDQLNTGLDDLAATRDSAESSWMKNTALGTALFSATLAMDIIYNDLDPNDCNTIETKIGNLASLISGWNPSPQGVKGLWALYKGDTSAFNAYRIDYTNEVFDLLTTDGVFAEGSGYACARFGSPSREQKTVFMDILEYHGYHDFYSSTIMRNMHEWLYGYAETPFGRVFTFGDSSPTSSHATSSSTQIYRAYRFGEKAARYAAWHTSGVTPWGRLLAYVLMEQAPSSSPELAPSRIFNDGGAWFVESTQSTDVLAGGLWNPQSSGWHSHKEINALAVAGYGEHLLRNSGYNGASEPDGSDGPIWNYINHQSLSANALMINDVNHSTKEGAGITEGFTAPKFDYASGDSGTALPNGSHQRNFVFVHPADGANGYWVVFDEADADNASDQVNVLLHPNSDNITTVSSSEEYQAEINLLTYSGHTVYLSAFLGTQPASVQIRNGWLASWNGVDIGDYLYSDYDTDSNGLVNIVTVLFPHDSTHAKATMTRISEPNYTGASIAQGSDINDIALESSGTNVETLGDVSFQGLATWYRLDSDLVSSYFVRKGQSFDDGLSPRVGFESSSDISIYIDDVNGRIISPGTNVTFYCPGIHSVSLDGGFALSNVSSGADWVQVNIPSGTYQVWLNTWDLADIDDDNDVDFEDFAILGSQWKQAPGTPSADIAPPGGDGIVDIQDFAFFAECWLDGE